MSLNPKTEGWPYGKRFACGPGCTFGGRTSRPVRVGTADQWAQRPNLASRNQSGTLYCLRESQVGLKGPSARMRGWSMASVGLGEVVGGELDWPKRREIEGGGECASILTAVRRDIFMIFSIDSDREQVELHIEK